MKLFCFPHAGSSVMSYSNWKKFINKSIVIELIELSGRGSRINEPLYNSMEELINDIYPKLSNKIQNTQYAFFGHSMGCVIAYELYYKLLEKGMLLPIHIFVSGRYPPNLDLNKDSKKHLLDDISFIKMLRELGGLSDSIYENKELLDIFLPIIRSDYKIVELYKHNKKTTLLNCNITVFNGKKDSSKVTENIHKWQNNTCKKFILHEFDGGHFFINSYLNKVIKIINHTLQNYNCAF